MSGRLLIKVLIGSVCLLGVLAPEVERQSGRRAASSTAATPPAGMVLIRGGAFEMGAPDGFTFERPVHKVAVSPFWIDAHEVTVSQFAAFVKATGYVTDAERFGWSAVFRVDDGAWARVEGADWRSPEGPNSVAKADEPVSYAITYENFSAHPRLFFFGSHILSAGAVHFERLAQGYCYDQAQRLDYYSR